MDVHVYCLGTVVQEIAGARKYQRCISRRLSSCDVLNKVSVHVHVQYLCTHMYVGAL